MRESLARLVKLAMVVAAGVQLSDECVRLEAEGRSCGPSVHVVALSERAGTIEGVVTVPARPRIDATYIHAPATPTENADIVLHLFAPRASTGTVDGELARVAAVSGSPLIAQDDLATLLGRLRDGRTYLMVHTDANPEGEIRGQVKLPP